MSRHSLIKTERNLLVEDLLHRVNLFLAQDARFRDAALRPVANISHDEVSVGSRSALIIDHSQVLRKIDSPKFVKQSVNLGLRHFPDLLDLIDTDIWPVPLLALIVLLEKLVELTHEHRANLRFEDQLQLAHRKVVSLGFALGEHIEDGLFAHAESVLQDVGQVRVIEVDLLSVARCQFLAEVLLQVSQFLVDHVLKPQLVIFLSIGAKLEQKLLLTVFNQ